MKRILSCICSIALFCNLAYGQNPKNGPVADSVQYKAEKREKVPSRFFIPTGVRIGTDLVALGINAFGGDRQRYEFQADIDFHRFYLVGEFGIASYESIGEEYRYTNEGSFYRVGVNVDFLKFDKDFNTFTVGLRYAAANYSENLVTNISSEIFGDYQENLSNPSVQARWFELTTGLRVMILPNLYTGYTFRIQLGKQGSNATNFRTYDVPGFGRAQFKNRWAFNYYLMYKINWRKKELLPRER